ncbi:MAG: hypothetical protein AVDCRST_MAG89-2983, partial [uncultured Gemmatimonadetes bacterium]
ACEEPVHRGRTPGVRRPVGHLLRRAADGGRAGDERGPGGLGRAAGGARAGSLGRVRSARLHASPEPEPRRGLHPRRAAARRRTGVGAGLRRARHHVPQRSRVVRAGGGRADRGGRPLRRGGPLPRRGRQRQRGGGADRGGPPAERGTAEDAGRPRRLSARRAAVLPHGAHGQRRARQVAARAGRKGAADDVAGDDRLLHRRGGKPAVSARHPQGVLSLTRQLHHRGRNAGAGFGRAAGEAGDAQGLPAAGALHQRAAVDSRRGLFRPRQLLGRGLCGGDDHRYCVLSKSVLSYRTRHSRHPGLCADGHGGTGHPRGRSAPGL